MLILCLFSLLVYISLPIFNSNVNIIIRTGFISLISAGFLVYNINTIGIEVNLYNNLIHVTSITESIEIILLIGGSIAIVPWGLENMENQEIEKQFLINKDNNEIFSIFPTIKTYPLFIIFTTVGGSLLVSSLSLITIYLAVELQSFAVYVLATLYRNSEKATKAGLLYFMLGGLSSTLILLGSALIYSSTGTINLNNIFSLITINDNTTILGFVILISGLLFKITAAPFHNWGPDVYDNVPTIVTIWLAVIPKVSLLGLIIEITLNNTSTWINVIIISSFLSLIIGSLLGLSQDRIKRLLAYSTVSHVGFILLAISINSTQSSLFYLGQYTITSINMFITLLGLGYCLYINGQNKSSDVGKINELTNVFKTQPLLAASLAVCFFSIAGVPPLIGFFAKLLVLTDTMSVENYFIALVAILTSVVSASYYLYVIRVMYFDKNINETITTTLSPLTWYHSYIIGILTLILTFFIVESDIIFNIINLISYNN